MLSSHSKPELTTDLSWLVVYTKHYKTEGRIRAAAFRTQWKPLDPTGKQLRDFRQVYDAVPWQAEEQLHAARFEKPVAPNYADFVDRSASSQEDLMTAFQDCSPRLPDVGPVLLRLHGGAMVCNRRLARGSRRKGVRA